MTHETYTMLREWLVDGDELQRRHAEHRLSLPDAVDYPPLLEQFGNAVSAVGRIASAIARGGHVQVDQAEQDRRLAICHACLPPEGFWDATQGRCMKCGCFGAFKAWLATERCPVGKW